MVMEVFVEDPKAWGYLPLGDGRDTFEVDPSEKDPFHLYILGSGPQLDISKELRHVVLFKRDLNYTGMFLFVFSSFAKADWARPQNTTKRCTLWTFASQRSARRVVITRLRKARQSQWRSNAM